MYFKRKFFRKKCKHFLQNKFSKFSFMDSEEVVFYHENKPNGQDSQTFYFNKEGAISHAVGKKGHRIQALIHATAATKINCVDPVLNKHWGAFEISTTVPKDCALAVRMLTGWMQDFDDIQIENSTRFYETYREVDFKNVPNGESKQTVKFGGFGEGGFVIGKEHKKIQEIAIRHNVQTRTFRPRDDGHGAIVISGFPENCDAAVREIRGRLWDKRCSDERLYDDW